MRIFARLKSIAITHHHSSFGQLLTCVEAKLERGTTSRFFESNEDVTEIKDLLTKISARIEAFLVSTLL